MEGHCSIGQSLQWAVVPMEEEEEEEEEDDDDDVEFLKVGTCYIKRHTISCDGYLCNNYLTAQRDVFGPGYLSRYSDSLRAGRSENRIPVKARLSSPVHTGPGVRGENNVTFATYSMQRTMG